MKSGLSNILGSKIFQISSAFLIGGITTYFVSDYIKLKNSVSVKEPIKSEQKIAVSPKKHDHDPFSDMDNIHDKMMKRMDKMFDSNLLGGSLLGNNFFNSNSFGSFSDSELQVEETEDDNFKYITIHVEGVDQEALKINITDGTISISGQIKKVDENKGGNSYSSSSYVSSFNKSFNVPYGVDGNNVKIENEKDKIILKFPKTTV
jgi:HSP20 family protein